MAKPCESPSKLIPSGRALFTKNSPALAKSFQLRQLRMEKKTIGMERIMSAPTQFPLENGKERDRRKKLAEYQQALRQRDEDERGLVAKAKADAVKMIRDRREKVREEKERLAAERQSAQLAAWKQQKEEREQKIREREAEERAEREERERIDREEEEAELIRRIPITCLSCKGDGKCPSCKGEQIHPALYLTQKVSSTSDIKGLSLYEFGQKPRGCTDCDGHNQGITGAPLRGTGICAKCYGAGKFCTGFCHINRRKKRAAKPVSTLTATPGTPMSPTAPMSPPTPKRRVSLLEPWEAPSDFCDKCGGRKKNPFED
eukprot:TRINITY_DN38384_c0_g1_i1.p1 TRINITY_DN38384_c0_g1~~TRINITY_DN38384_c0_g1_i1.p1  ORF type:complete len:317 (-),score=86.58 TRINITY_DN38384_c0_g1_i1:202-1152(-)